MSEDFMCITSIRNCLCCDKEMKGDDDFCVACEKDDLERQLAEAREAIKEHKKRKKSWGFEGSDYDKVLWEQLKEK